MTSIPPRGVRVLLVSEDPAVCALAERVLARRGDTLIVAHSVEDGVERGVELAVDVAFVDVSEQQRMGLTLVHALRTASARTSIHALTTKHAVDAGAQALSLGADGVVLVLPREVSHLRDVGRRTGYEVVPFPPPASRGPKRLRKASIAP